MLRYIALTCLLCLCIQIKIVFIVSLVVDFFVHGVLNRNLVAEPNLKADNFSLVELGAAISFGLYCLNACRSGFLCSYFYV
jgi:hypothetical protein